jgi:hypothetical protein
MPSVSRATLIACDPAFVKNLESWYGELPAEVELASFVDRGLLPASRLLWLMRFHPDGRKMCAQCAVNIALAAIGVTKIPKDHTTWEVLEVASKYDRGVATWAALDAAIRASYADPSADTWGAADAMYHLAEAARAFARAARATTAADASDAAQGALAEALYAVPEDQRWRVLDRAEEVCGLVFHT